VTDEVNARIRKARLAFAKVRHLWRQNGLSLNLKGRVYQAAVRAVLLCGCEPWPIRAADLRRLQHQKLRWLGHVLRMPNHRLPKTVQFSIPNSEWCNQRGGQPLTWQRSMKEITKRLVLSVMMMMSGHAVLLD
ncbi:hypothetical protein T265_14616, partial [Opisthorchis viverrini]